MPCDQIITTRVDLGKASGPLLDAALKALGYESVKTREGLWRNLKSGMTVVRQGDDLVIRSAVGRGQNEAAANAIRREYSRQVVGKVAAQTGWVPRKVAEGKYVMERR